MYNNLKIKIVSICAFLLFTLMFNANATPTKDYLDIEFAVLQELKTKKVSLRHNDASIKVILNDIRKQTGLQFAVRDNELNESLQKLSISVTDQNVESVLIKLLHSRNYVYKVTGNTIFIEKGSVPSKQPITMNVKGVVVNKDNKPIVGATIIVKESDKGAITDPNGAFSIDGLKVGDVLEVSYSGMIQENVILKDSTNELIIVMSEDIMAVEDIVVTGIFERPRESYTGAVTTISEKEIKMYKGQNLLQTIRNVDPALNIVQNNDFGSDPNRLPEINIRGNSSLPASMEDLNSVEEDVNAQLNAPLIIMDGFEISVQRLMDFNDEEIQSINILKDAAAVAIYGSRGANGVIVITSKAPVAGKLKIFVSGGLNLEMPDLTTYDLLNASEKLEYERSIGLYDPGESYDNYVEPLANSYNENLRAVRSGVDTDWIAQPVRTGIGQKYNARVEGGSNEFRWGVSLGYNQITGAMKESSREVFNGAITLSYTHKNVIFKNQLSYNSSTGYGTNYGSFEEYVKMNPYLAIYDKNGYFIEEYNYRMWGQTDDFNQQNPLYNTQFNHLDKTVSNGITNNFSIEWRIMDGLTARGRFSISSDNNSSDKFISPFHTNYENHAILEKGNYTYGVGEQTRYDFSATVNYSKVFAEKHQVYVGVDYSIRQSDNTSYTFSTTGFRDDSTPFLSSGLRYNTLTADGDEGLARSLGLTASVNYTFNNKYFIDGNYRIDGTSQFGSNKKFAPFFSGGIGWNLHNEDFLKKVSFINSLRAKFSYGQTGSLSFSAYEALITYKEADVLYAFHQGYAIMGHGNPDLEWQTTDQFNTGIEFAVLKNRIRGSFDAYSKITNGLISSLYSPVSTGFSTYKENVGAISNKGFEASITGSIIRDTEREIIWNVTAKIAHNKNIIEELSDVVKAQNEEYMTNEDFADNDNLKFMFEGHSQNSIYTVPSLGINPSNGKELFLNPDGTVTEVYNALNRTLAGVSDPKYRGNINSSLTYKELTFSLSFGYHWGGQQYNQTAINRVEVSKLDARENVDRRVSAERWAKPGDIVLYKSIESQIHVNDRTRKTSRFVQDDNMFSLQSASISYRWATPWVKEHLKTENINFSLNMSDIFYVSTIKRERGLNYPFARRASFTVALMF